jgi:hypothetical protein
MQRLSELHGSFEVYALCPPCERMEALPLRALMNRFGMDVTLSDIRPRLRCRVCGERNHELRVVYVGPEGRPVVFQYRR